MMLGRLGTSLFCVFVQRSTVEWYLWVSLPDSGFGPFFWVLWQIRTLGLVPNQDCWVWVDIGDLAWDPSTWVSGERFYSNTESAALVTVESGQLL